MSIITRVNELHDVMSTNRRKSKLNLNGFLYPLTTPLS